MNKIGIIFLLIAVIFFVLGTLMFFVQKLITSRIYHKQFVVEEESIKKIDKLNKPDKIDISLLEENDNDEMEEL